MSAVLITLAAIRAQHPCRDRWSVLLRGLAARGYTADDPRPFPLEWVLDICGLDDTLWAFRAVVIAEGAPEWRRLLAADYAEHVLPIYEAQYPDDPRPRHAIETARQYALGRVTAQEMAAAGGARAAVWAASDAWAAELSWQEDRLRAYCRGHLPAPVLNLLAKQPP